MSPPYLRPVTGGVEVLLAVRPRASRTRIAGQLGDRLKLQVAAPPVDGRANETIRTFLADRLGVAKSSVSIAAGDTGTRKTVRIEGVVLDHAERCLGVDA